MLDPVLGPRTADVESPGVLLKMHIPKVPGWLSRSSVLDFGSGRDLAVVRSSLASGSVMSGEPAWDSLSPSLSALPLCSRSFSLSK